MRQNWRCKIAIPFDVLLNLAKNFTLSLFFATLSYLAIAAPGYYTPDSIQQNSLSSVLNADGSIRPGTSGSFNTKGFTMSYGKDGSPIFHQEGARGANGNDGNWDNTASMGVASPVNAVAIFGGNIYVGSSNVFKWDGSKWTVPGGGITGAVYAMAVQGGKLWIGGNFTKAGALPAKNIVTWDGANWSAVGPGMDSTVYALSANSSSPNDLYAGGSFTNAGGVTAQRIAKWNGTSWSALGSGMNKDVRCMYCYGTDIYAGGEFTTAGGTPANRIARWNGTTWSPMGSGMDEAVFTIAVTNSIVYAGGRFYTAGGVSVRQIAKYDGTAWSPVGTTELNKGQTYVTSIIVRLSGEIYVAWVSNYTSSDGSVTSGIAKWNSYSWSAASDQARGTINAIAYNSADGYLYTGGFFNKVGDLYATNVAKWNLSSSWYALGTAINGKVSAIAIQNNDVYIAGAFSSVGKDSTFGIAKWDGISWKNLANVYMGGNWAPGFIVSMIVSGNDVFVGGVFSSIGGVNATGVAKWNGTSWLALGTLAADINCMALYGGQLVVGGNLYSVNGTPTRGLAKWNGTSWSAFTPALSGSTIVRAMAVDGNDLYVGGLIDSANGIKVYNLVKWNGTAWSTIADSIGMVAAIAARNGKVYVAGDFTTIGGVTANHIAVWNGSSWSALHSGINGNVFCIHIDNSDVYIGGNFTTAGGIPADNIAKWDGNSWESFGSGIQIGGNYAWWGFPTWGVSALATKGNDLFAGGNIGIAGNKPAPYFAIYHKDNVLPVSCAHFTYQWMGKNIKLEWTTGTEYNNHHFEVERSYDGLSFFFIAKINANPSGNYSFTDHEPLSTEHKIVYYRLRQVDKDGTEKIICTTLRASANTKDDMIKIFPVPAKEKVTISGVNLNKVELWTVSGSLVAGKTSGNNSLEISLKHLLPGTYLLKIFDTENNVTTRKIVKE